MGPQDGLFVWARERETTSSEVTQANIQVSL